MPHGGMLGVVLVHADERHAGASRLPAVGAAAHPVVGVAQGDQAEAMLLRQRNRAIGGGGRIQVARAELPVPLLPRTKPRRAYRLGTGRTTPALICRTNAETGSARARPRRRDASRQTASPTAARAAAENPRPSSTRASSRTTSSNGTRIIRILVDDHTSSAFCLRRLSAVTTRNACGSRRASMVVASPRSSPSPIIAVPSGHSISAAAA